MRDLPEWAIPLGILIGIITAFIGFIAYEYKQTHIYESWLD